MATRNPPLALSIGILIAAAALFAFFRMTPESDLTGAATAIDGDSIRIAGEEVRLKGIDAPELQQTCTVSGRQTACGRESLTALRLLLSSGLATCVGGERDRYGRLLALCRVRGIDVGAAMVREGRAVAFGAYEIEEAEARARYVGLWGGEFERPSDWRARHPQRTQR